MNSIPLNALFLAFSIYMFWPASGGELSVLAQAARASRSLMRTSQSRR